MSAWFVLLSIFAAVNPARVSARLSATAIGPRRRYMGIAVAITAVVVVALGLAGRWVLDVLDLTDETWRIASGAVAVLAGGRYLALSPGSTLPELTLPVHAVVPVTFPLLLVPELAVLVVLYGATDSFALLALGSAVALGAAVGWGGTADGPVNRGLVRLLAALLVVVGIGLLVAGIRDV